MDAHEELFTVVVHTITLDSAFNPPFEQAYSHSAYLRLGAGTATREVWAVICSWQMLTGATNLSASPPYSPVYIWSYFLMR